MAFVQGDKGSTAGATTVATAGITTTSGNMLVATVSVDNGPKTVSSLTDSKGNTWTALTGNPQSATGSNIYAYYAKNITGGAGHTLTANLSGSAPASISLAEFSGRDTVSPVVVQQPNQESTRSSSHSSAATGTIPNSGCDLVVLVGDSALFDLGANETYTPGTGWTLPAASDVNTAGTTTTSYLLYKENVGTTTDTATWTNSAGTITAASWIIALAPVGGATSLSIGTLTASVAIQSINLSRTGGGGTFIMYLAPVFADLILAGGFTTSTGSPGGGGGGGTPPVFSANASNLTYLQLVNQVLQALRESSVNSVQDNSYSKLIGKWINDAKRQVEDAWDWQVLNATSNFSLVPLIGTLTAPTQVAQQTYYMNNTAQVVSVYDFNPLNVAVNMTERARLRTDVQWPPRPMAFDMTVGLPMQLIKQPADWILRTRFIQPTKLTQTQPMFFGLIHQGGTVTVELFEYPIAVRNWQFCWTLPQPDLVADSDYMLVPWYPVTSIATDIAMNERGEEVGEPGETVAQRAILHISNAIALDGRDQEHKETFYFD